MKTFFSPNLSIRQNFCAKPEPGLHPKTEVLRFKGKLVRVNATVHPNGKEGNRLDDNNTVLFQ